MFYDLNIPWPAQIGTGGGSSSKSSKKKQQRKDDVAGEGGSMDCEQTLSPIQYEKMKALTVDLSERECRQYSEGKGAWCTLDTSLTPLYVSSGHQQVGYGTCAYNHVVEGKFDPNRHRNPFCPTHSQVSRAPFPEFDPDAASTSSISLSQSDTRMRQLSRMTLILNDDSMGKVGHGMTAAGTTALLGYDLLAAQAFNDASFSLLCLTLSELKPNGIDIISLDLSTSPRLPFFLKRSTVNAALANGVVFEICYSRVVNRGESRETASRDRKNIIATARDILRVTNGKGVIFSSGASDVLGVRGPNDVVNLATIFGLNKAAAQDCISSACRSLIMRAETRKTFRGVIAQPTVVSLADAPAETTGERTKRKAEGEVAEGLPKRQRAEVR